ncbi:hybrid sensor histidine kinase/response regulator [Seonamhaeicola sp. S2-3]|uniref:hybrid sensor histidine kinase/response regulator transcription factor n=1 Tax=Seonamhaeicola sp. S2-3 TaxID=1936081 RepID=UPI000972D714|nr:two-component regulator propeller domain-containing protein [Seonamhaeicola sp. S2-3]APY11854.1 hybrid sensor histidine kinase/response regulator [Seonamhaeicola sp. S2-3]
MRKHFIIFFVFGFIAFGGSQNNIYKFKHLSTSDGLSQNSIIAINQDSLGQIWIGTRDGLNKYDGSEFTVYRHDKNDSLSISNNDIFCIENDSNGFIWVGTHKGLNKYDPRKKTFKTFLKNRQSTSLASNRILTVKELKNKEIWVGVPSGLSVYNEATDTFKNYTLQGQVYSIFEAKSGAVFIGTSKGLVKLLHKSKERYSFQTIVGTEGIVVQALEETELGNLLLGTEKQSILEYNPDDGVLKPYLDEFTLKGNNKNVRQLLFDGSGNLWAGTYHGVQVINQNKDLFAIYSSINDDESISGNFIKSLFKDRKGSIWVGTYHEGLNIWDESNINFINIIRKSGGKGLSFNAVSSIVNHDSIVFFGTEGGGISILNTRTKSFEYLTTKNYPNLKSDNIKSLFLSENNNIWAGTFKNGLVVYDIVEKKIKNNLLPKKLLDYTDNIGINSISEDVNKNIWIGTRGRGVIKYNAVNRSFKILNSRTNKNISNNIIRAVYVDSKNNVWATTAEGLNFIGVNGKVKNYFYDAKTKVGISTIAVFESYNGIIWVGTEFDGLFKLSNNKFVPVNLSIDDTTVMGIRSIVEDEKGLLWLSTTNNGIICFSPQRNQIIKNYTQKDGLKGNQFNNNASLRIGGSSFIFGGGAGASYFDSNNLVENEYAPQVLLTDFKIKNKSVGVNKGGGLLSETITYTDNVELSHDQGSFSITFSMPSFINSSRNTYLYRLKGLEEEWIETSQNTAFYTIQNPGNYTFEVKGINNDGVANNAPTTLNVRVNPAPWRSWWAFLFYGIFVFFVLYYLMNILKSRTKLKHQLALEQIEVEQTKSVNKAKLEFFTNISHEFRTPLTLILGPLNQMLDNYRGSSSMYKKLKVIESSANHLLQLINRLMDFRKLENNLMKLEAAEGNVVKFMQEIYLSFSEYAKSGGYDYTFQTSSDNIQIYYDRYKLERVFYNLISNAFRYTPKGGKIVLKIIEETGKICIRVEDSGVGIAEEYRDKIFERFFELPINRKPDKDYNKGTGIGLSIVKNIVDLHKGQIKVFDNEVGTGSVFSIELPLGRKHLEDEEIIQDFKFSDDLEQYVSQLEEQETILEKDALERKHVDEKPTVLIVEDNKRLRKFIVDILINDYNILEAENGKVAYKLAISEQVELIVSDVVMPEMTGTELCSLVKENIRTSHIPVILLTSRSSLIFKMDGLESGADDYISKPFNVKEFKLRIKNILSTILRLKEKINSNEILQPGDIVLSSLDEKLYKKALAIVEENISNEQFDIQFFCEELGVSRTDLFTKVKAWTGFTPKDFIQHIRLKRGAQYLEQGKFSISQISYNIGFKNPKYFSKCFKKKFGKTPTEYIKTFSDY